MSVSSAPPVAGQDRIPRESARRIVFWVVAVTAAVVLIMSTVDAITADPQQGEGWIGGPIEAVFMGGPLIAVMLGLRSSRQDVAKRTAVAALALALVVAFVLVMQVLDPNESTANRLLQAFGMLVYLAVFSVELPALTRRWPSSTRTRS